MKRFTLGVLLSALLLALAAWAPQRAAADDETGDTEIKIQAPLDAVDCTANTISVLGLTIDISTAAIGDGNGDQGDQGDNNQGDDQGDDNSGDDGNGGTGGCASLVAG